MHLRNKQTITLKSDKSINQTIDWLRQLIMNYAGTNNATAFFETRSQHYYVLKHALLEYMQVSGYVYCLYSQ